MINGNKRSDKSVQKAVRFTPEMWGEIESCIVDQGISFSAFCNMASRLLLNRFEDEKQSRLSGGVVLKES